MKNNFFKVGQKYIGENKQVFIIAEIGINHSGDHKKCKKMITEAAKAGADAVKIQTIDVDESYMKNTQSYKEFKNKNFSNKELVELKRHSSSLGVIFFSTPGDIKSLTRLIKIKVQAIKISSGLATNFPLIKESIKKKIPIIISIGFLTMKDLKDLNNFIKKHKYKKIAILKCTSQYPANPSNLDLYTINFLKIFFNLPIGYSDHTTDDLAPVVAVANGAKIIEKHFTLNKLQKGADHKISLEPKEFINMVNKIRTTEEMLGKKVFRINDESKKKRNMYLRYLTAKKNIKKGDVLSLDNIGFFRHNRKKSGLEPKYFFHLKSKKSKANFRKNQIISKKILN